mmetsp:Transcript_24462/g.35964  ORF Transcript_24462/g.35964 Transcript_24462/m.35964 type:complete len:293 (-) Transcript_24462:168-1046(-)|eukprot:CAMPEP_0185026300 /NCGR_PEP_ID=MMETSP1103-20130426/10209_1 /TAXON_ID=36769 /ORGANISM="Paraphysomonas bandaiensis, Strain Caron Lab Isolate" /LENGTH=292 /DNA_ID=CAMNT_0027559817 /DNA_START=103 /DNA_END=981 /DNA_ORIENTATION=-
MSASIESFTTITVKHVYNKDAGHVKIYLPRNSRVCDVKRMIQIEDEMHPDPLQQKLIFKGKIPSDQEFLCDVLRIAEQSTEDSPVFHLVISATTTSGEKDDKRSPNGAGVGVVFDPCSVQAAEAWLSSAGPDEQHSVLHRSARTTLLAAKAALQHEQGENLSPDGNEQDARQQPMQQQQQQDPIPAVFNFRVLTRIALSVLLIGRNFSIPTQVIAGLLYYLYETGWMGHLTQWGMRAAGYGVGNGRREGSEGAVQWVASIRPGVPRLGGPVMDLLALLSAFFLSLFPSWHPE